MKPRTRNCQFFKTDNVEEYVKRTEQRLASADITPVNKELVTDFLRDKKLGLAGYKAGHGIGLARQLKYLNELPYLVDTYEAITQGKCLRDINEAEIKDLVAKIDGLTCKQTKYSKKKEGWITYDTGRPLANSTKNNYFGLLSLLLKWMRQEEKPKETRSIPRLREEGRYGRSVATIEWEHLPQITEHAQNPRDRCIPWLMMDIPAEPESVMQIRVGDLKPKEYVTDDNGDKKVVRTFAVFIRKGKTSFRERTVELTDSASYIAAWLRFHPRRNDPNSPLFVDLVYPDKCMTKVALATMLRRLMEKSGLDFPSHPYFFRHSSASWWAKKIPRHTLEHRGGWAPGSKALAKHYLHEREDEANRVALEVKGLRPRKTEEEENGIRCKWCNARNNPKETSCVVCGSALDLNTEELLTTIQIRRYIDENYLTADFVKGVIDSAREKFAKEIGPRKVVAGGG